MPLDSIEFDWPEWEPTWGPDLVTGDEPTIEVGAAYSRVPNWSYGIGTVDATSLAAVAKEVWNSDTLAKQFYAENPLLDSIDGRLQVQRRHNQLTGKMLVFKNREPEPGWFDAVRWLERREAKRRRAAEEWPWPT